MSDFRNFLNKQLEDPEFKAEWEALQPELSLVQAMIDARKVSGLTQKELSERTGIAQADISKLENGNANPSLRTLQRLAAGMGMQVKIETGSFLTAARSLQGRSYAAGGTRYLLPDLMLLTHTGCAFKDPRGRFGISNTLPGAVRGGRENEIRSLRKCSFARSSCSVQGGGAAVSHCCVAQ